MEEITQETQVPSDIIVLKSLSKKLDMRVLVGFNWLQCLASVNPVMNVSGSIKVG
jgi:hypothetical protein